MREATGRRWLCAIALFFCASEVDGQFATNYDSAGRDEGSHNEVSSLIRGGSNALEKKRYDRAIQFFDAAMALHPKEEIGAEILTARADAYTGQGDSKKAKVDLERALRFLVLVEKAHPQRAEVYEKMGNYRAAVAERRKQAQLAPDDASGWSELAWLQATAPAKEARNGQEAVKAATRACEMTNWRRAVYLDTLAASYAETGNFASAVEYETRALKTGFISREDRKDFDARLARYVERKPFRQESGATGGKH